MRLRIMLTTSVLTGGGAERVVSVWASELAEKGYDISLLLAGRTENEYPLSDKVKVYTIAPTYSEYQKLSKTQKILGRRAVLKSVRPNYLISFLPHIQVLSFFASAGLGIKRIETVRISPWRADYNHGLNKILWKLCFETGSGVVLQSKDQAGYFKKAVQKKCVVIPNPISEIYETSYKKFFQDNVTTLIAAGRLTEQKNYFMMIDAFALAIGQMQTANKPILKIFGAEDSSDYTKKLRAFIQEKGMEEQILLMGRSSHIEEEYASADVFLMSSDYEGMPNALAEAMASRLVCISTDCQTGPRDLIDHGQNGYLVPVGDVKAMAEAIKKACSMSKQQRMDIGDLARAKIMTYCSKENSIEKLCDLLGE